MNDMAHPVAAPPHAAFRHEVSERPETAACTVAAVIPCYRVRAHILSVIDRIGPECSVIYVIDDKCPEGSGKHVQEHCRDPRVRVIFHEENRGVGGAVMTGYRAAIEDGVTIAVKVDGDGQMDPALIPIFIAPILAGAADYTKGNRFFNVEDAKSMPAIRLFGNAVLSFMSKFSSGYWTIFDPANGYTAIHAAIARQLPLEKIRRRYFFESDMLFRLNTIRAKVVDVPMVARYGDEKSGLVVRKILGEFLVNHLGNFVKRIAYNYFLRDFSLASLELVVGALFVAFGTMFGAYEWYRSVASGIVATAGTVMLAVLPIVLGVQLLLSFIGYDVASTPSEAIHPLLSQRPRANHRER